MVLNLIDTIGGWFKPISDWIGEHNDSWFFWVGAVLVALAIFGIVMEALKKEK